MCSALSCHKLVYHLVLSHPGQQGWGNAASTLLEYGFPFAACSCWPQGTSYLTRDDGQCQFSLGTGVAPRTNEVHGSAFSFFITLQTRKAKAEPGALPAVACHLSGPILPQRVRVYRRKAELSLERLQHARMRLAAGAGFC